MKINKIQEITFDTEDSIMASSLSTKEECVLLLSSGNVIRYNFNERTIQNLFSVENMASYSDGGFDINAPSSIYTLDSIVVVVNDYKRHGFIHYPGQFKRIHLWREGYYEDISRYPISMFKDESGVPHIIYSVAWNHLQIMNLDTRQVITAAKSLIKEFAEEDYIKFHEQYKEPNKRPWPSPYDYFFGQLQMSPNQKKFLSAGWAWGSYDVYNIYDLEHFMTNNRIAEELIDGWEHNNRGVCWIDDDTIAVTYNPYEEGEDNSNEESLSEIHFYKMNDKQSELKRKIKIDGIPITSAEIYYNKAMNALLAYSDKIGLAVLSMDGQIIFYDDKFKPDGYNPELDLFIKTQNKMLSVYQLIS